LNEKTAGKDQRHLIQNVGTGTIPIIKVEDADYGNNRYLFQTQPTADPAGIRQTLQYLAKLWSRKLLSKPSSTTKNPHGFADDKLTIKPVH
jgi:spore cortex formation protein SpoVR/YcgB (stage V sporulation)